MDKSNKILNERYSGMDFLSYLEKNASANVVEKYKYYKKCGYSDNQSFVLSVFTYSSGYSRSLSGLELAISNYTKKDTQKPFCDYLVTLLSKLLEKYEYDNESMLLEHYLGNKMWAYFQKSDLNKSFSGFESMRCSSNFGGFGSSGGYGFGNSFSSNPPKAKTGLFGKNNKESVVFKSVQSDVFADIDPCVSDESFDVCCDAMFDCEEAAFSPMSSPMINNAAFESFVKDNIRTDSYERIEEKGFVSPLTSPTSTFRMTQNTASVGNVFEKLKNRMTITKDMVRIEEFLNYYKYDLLKPTNRMFNIITEVCDKPKVVKGSEKDNKKLLFIGVQGKEQKVGRQNIAFLLDVSGSMSSNAEQCQLAFFTVLGKMNNNDILSLITYSDDDTIIYDSLVLNKEKDIDNIIKEFLSISITGCTYGSKGIESAYTMIQKNFIKDGVNNVILMTDGDLNFGITDKCGLEEFILEKKKTGAFLSVIGTGIYNNQDDKLEVLSKNGNGTYCVVNDLVDIDESIFDKYDSFVYSIAKDVKSQVEFNPKFVKKYRLLGYENRGLSHEDFKNDKVISEPFGSSGYGVALYELEMTDEAVVTSDLKYQKPQLTDSNEICTVSVRYKLPDSDTSEELSVNVKNKKGYMSDNIRLAYSIYCTCEKLRKSDYVDNLEALYSTMVANFELSEKIENLNGNRLNNLRALMNYANGLDANKINPVQMPGWGKHDIIE